MVLGSCQKGNSDFIETLIKLSPARYQSERPSEEKIAEWEREISKYKLIIEKKVDAAAKSANYYKLLAEEYSSLAMYGLALDNYRQAIELESANQVLFYSAALVAAQYGKSKESETETRALFQMSRRYYERALEIAPGYRDPYLGLTVLLMFELDDQKAARDLLNKALQLFPGDSRLLFLLARVAVEDERIDDAIEIYDRISRIARNPDEVKSATLNREALVIGE